MKIIVNSGGKNYGWYSPQQIRELVIEGAIHFNDFAWFESSTAWTSVYQALEQLRNPYLKVQLRPFRPEEPVETQVHEDRKRTTILLSAKRKSPGLWKAVYS